MKKTFRLVAGVVVILLIALVSGPLLDHVLVPWAFARDGHPALTGHWVGRLTTVTGRPYGVMLELVLPEPKGRGGLVRDWEYAPYGELGGQARLCDERGRERLYTIDGQPDDRHATHITLHASPSEDPVSNGLTMSWVKGTWDGADGLALTVDFQWEQDGGVLSGPEYPDTRSEAKLPMVRGDQEQFASVCGQVRNVVR